MRAEILAVGTELLLGNIVNTNAQFLSQRLADLGIDVYRHTVVGDNPDRLKNAIKEAFERADLVITTGGLGPTKDDLTKEIAFEYFNKKAVLNKESLEKIEKYFEKLNRDMVDSNKKQAYFPKDVTILANDVGTAPGCAIDEKGKILILLPGPPREMKPMFENHVITYLSKYSEDVLTSKILRVMGIGESKAEEMIKDIIDGQSNPTIAPYAKEGEMIFRITAKAKCEEEGYKLIEPVEKEIRERLGIAVYAEGETTLETTVGEMLVKNHLTISVVESCTGGLLSGTIINYPGISKVFLEGAVTYSNDAKMKRLGVSKKTLEEHGAVSRETAEEMAKGMAQRAETNIAISTTGVAGPGGGTKEKPVGLVYVGLYINGEVKSKEFHLVGNREKIRYTTVMRAIEWLRREIIRLVVNS
ncbi:competence/damage-inducible protein A [Clostridium sediminicola]|uniref:competence/damage-inducible protein A n=1 Tax=Clostridium sediminicola TaxID=3114879 RepID=UPI0031F1D315